MSQQWNSARYAQNAAFVSELGLPVMTLLDPQAGEAILDLGCGEGSLAQKLMALDCQVTGVDSSADMVAAAKTKGVAAQCVSGDALQFEAQFDAVFSNAALHWMTNYHPVLEGVYRALRDGGRFVAEMGGFGNIRCITDAISSVFAENPSWGQYTSPWFFPSDSEYRALLEQHGFVVEQIELIDRPTPLNAGISEWLRIFAEHATAQLTAEQKESFLSQVEERVKKALYSEEDGWVADYVRLRFRAHKPALNVADLPQR